MKIGMVSLGCAKNQVDAEIMLGQIKNRNHEIVVDPDEAEVIVVNTCAFIESAREEAINAILEMASKKTTGSLKYLIVTGCLAQRHAEDIKKYIPEVDGIIGVGGFDKICDCIDELEKKDKFIYNEPAQRLDYLNSARVLTTPVGVAYLKIAEGCDNRCAYCAIPYIRGPFRSRPVEDLLKEAERLVEMGVKEIILVAQDSTRYGLDLYGKPKLSELLVELDKIEKLKLVRVMYLYPDEITAELIDVMKKCEKVAKYVDLPLQHISDKILKAMNRRGSSTDIRTIIREFREAIPEVVIRTSLIVGFPGETRKEFDELCDFVKEMEFDRVGVFAYSKEEGTKAASMPNQVGKKEKTARVNKLMEILLEFFYQQLMSFLSFI
jgi:ribosomal protein S12 methylthiotransferase